MTKNRNPFPPFLVCSAAQELPGLAKQAHDFCKGLQANGARVKYYVIPNSSHFSVMVKFKTNSQVEKLCVDFVRSHSSR